MFNLVIKDIRLFFSKPLSLLLTGLFFLYTLGDFWWLMASGVVVLNQDVRYQMDMFYNSLPINRIRVVLSRYIVGLLFIGLGFGLSCASVVMIRPFLPTFRRILPVEGLLGIGVFFYFLLMILYPIFFRLGSFLHVDKKGIIWSVIGGLLVCMMMAAIILFFELKLYEIKHIYWYIGMAGVLLLPLSVFTSIQVYQRREF